MERSQFSSFWARKGDFYFSSKRNFLSFSRMRIEITVLTTPLMGLGEKIESQMHMVHGSVINGIIKYACTRHCNYVGLHECSC